MDENEQYSPRKFYYPDKETNENLLSSQVNKRKCKFSLPWQEPEVKQGSLEN